MEGRLSVRAKGRSWMEKKIFQAVAHFCREQQPAWRHNGQWVCLDRRVLCRHDQPTSRCAGCRAPWRTCRDPDCENLFRGVCEPSRENGRENSHIACDCGNDGFDEKRHHYRPIPHQKQCFPTRFPRAREPRRQSEQSPNMTTPRVVQTRAAVSKIPRHKSLHPELRCIA